MPDSEHTERIDLVFQIILSTQPYDCEANEVVANAIRDFLTDHPEYIGEFEEFVLTYDPEEHGKCGDEEFL